jgi:starvation-inducible outer membrane lipoprotein
MKWLVVTMSLLLGGCATMPQGDLQVSEKTRQVIAGIQKACAFAPTVASIASLVSKSSAPVFSLIAEVCLAVTSVPLAEGGSRRVIVRGVEIRGRKI